MIQTVDRELLELVAFVTRGFFTVVTRRS